MFVTLGLIENYLNLRFKKYRQLLLCVDGRHIYSILSNEIADINFYYSKRGEMEAVECDPVSSSNYFIMEVSGYYYNFISDTA